MSYVADLHTHSKYARACSPALNIPNLSEWGNTKGINLLGTGDFLHPLWFAELKRDLKEDGSGFLVHDGSDLPAGRQGTKFVLSVEIASIYSHPEKVGRRIHNIVAVSSFAAAEKLQKALLAKGAKLASDGRPIVGISSKNLLSMVLEADEKALFIPAHAWTPWFGVFGSKSGYDSLQECFEDLTPYVYAIETGISSDPAMNWRVKELDNKSIVSFSDAHSLPNLGREATILDGDFTYDGLWKAISSPSVIASSSAQSANGSLNDSLAKQSSSEKGINQIAASPLESRLDFLPPRNDKIIGTIEFYPEEGKYHLTGHRKCQVRYTPDQTKRNGTVCPKCGRELTVGVMERVEEVANRTSEELKVQSDESGIIKSGTFPTRAGFRKLVPLMQIIAESIHSTVASQKSINEYKKLTENLGSEISILSEIDIADIAKISGSRVAEGVMKARRGEIVIDPGYDGEYGVVKIWPDKEAVPQMGLFEDVLKS
ncbi:MAG: endonuclease Q family protein [Candidatus Daviesbacteria bacterium]|nr:endonuclease Q family protein [Candidatus Daviesbacteria bacterium]